MKTIFFDIDGTLAKFHDAEHNYIEAMWQEGFYKNLEPFENIVKAANYIKNNIKDINVAVISAYLDTEPPFVQKEKIEWLNEYLPNITDIRLVPAGTDKGTFVSEQDGEAWLVDDYNKNLNEWEQAGHHSIKFVNNINDKGMGAYGGEKGSLWQGAKVNYKTSAGNLVKKISNLMGVDYKLTAQEIDNEINQTITVKNDKFVLSDEKKILSNGTETFRLIAIKDFADVKIGDMGGFVEKEENLMSVGNCWIYNDAVVYGSALIADNAVVKDMAVVNGDAFVCGNSEISKNAEVTDCALVNGVAVVTDNAVIGGYSRVTEYAKIQNNARCIDCSDVSGYAVVSNDSILKGRVNVSGNVKVLNGTYDGPISYNGDEQLGRCESVLDKLNRAKNDLLYR